MPVTVCMNNIIKIWFRSDDKIIMIKKTTQKSNTDVLVSTVFYIFNNYLSNLLIFNKN